jgi:hypothetical protein
VLNPADAAEWRPIEGFPGYEVSSHGEVFSLPRYAGLAMRPGRLLKQDLSRGGYPSVRLSRGGRKHTFHVHHLVTDAFLGPLPAGLERLHKDGVRTNCRLDNLEFGTHIENMQDRLRHGRQFFARGARNGQAKLTEAAVSEIRARYAAGGVLQRELAAEYGVNQARISEAISGKTWTIRRIREEIRQGAPVPEDPPAGASAHTPRVPGPPAGVTPNGHQPAERR